MKLFQRKSKQADLTKLDDAALVIRAKTDNEAFGALYERYVEKIYKYIYYRTGNHQDAEDLTSAVFQRAMNHIASYDERGVPFQAWLYRIAHNLVANWHRDRSRRKIIPLEEFVSGGLSFDAPDSAAEDKEERNQLLAAINRLPEERQQLLYLKFIANLSNAEVGEILERTEGAIKSLYHRTLIGLREDIEMQQANRHIVNPPRQKEGKQSNG